MVDLVRDIYVESLEQFKADIALHPEQSVPDWVSRQPVLPGEFTLIAARGHQAIADADLGADGKVPLDLYCELDHVIFSPEGHTVSLGDAALARIGRKRRVVLTLPYFFSICRVVSRTDYVSLIPSQLARRLAPELGLDLFQPPLHVQSPPLVATWHRRNDDDPAHRWLRGHIQTILDRA